MNEKKPDKDDIIIKKGEVNPEDLDFDEVMKRLLRAPSTTNEEIKKKRKQND